MWGGPRGYTEARWEARFTLHTPTALITAALDEVVEPLPATRLYGQVPAPNLTQARIEARRPRPAAAVTLGQRARIANANRPTTAAPVATPIPATARSRRTR
ncbi:DUF317 domain-containing protein [Kitasatospora sp. NPDC004669]|uniref:DUF317 domain-containing protein n=1 Tax=Kitasatospora sp. NPDC004669 TaxID=3154555 RepID=UPI0033BA2244